MKIRLPEKLWQLQWHVLFAGLAVIALVVGVIAQALPALGASFLVLLYFAGSTAVFGLLLLLTEAVKNGVAQREKIEQISDAISANKEMLAQIARGVKLSETAKTIAYRDMDRQQLGASVIEKLHQQDFEATYAMIEEIAARAEYRKLADKLRETADSYRDATDQERVGQQVSYIEKLFDRHQWTNASVQIERLAQKFPDSPQVVKLGSRLIERKEQRKRELLDDWDKAVKKSDVDRSLLILKELDMYLTPGEGLALQEAASEMFKNKLHNMGVQFSLAVSEKRWDDALASGREIIKEFPNSRMADEIRGKITILAQLADH